MANGHSSVLHNLCDDNSRPWDWQSNAPRKSRDRRYFDRASARVLTECSQLVQALAVLFGPAGTGLPWRQHGRPSSQTRQPIPSTPIPVARPGSRPGSTVVGLALGSVN